MACGPVLLSAKAGGGLRLARSVEGDQRPARGLETGRRACMVPPAAKAPWGLWALTFTVRAWTAAGSGGGSSQS